MSPRAQKPDNGLFTEAFTAKRGRPSKPKPEPQPPRKRGPKPKNQKDPTTTSPGRISKRSKEPCLSGMTSALNNILDINNGSGDIDVNKVPIIIDNIEEIIQGVDFKEKMTPSELKFIQYHLVKRESIKRSMMLSGFDCEVEGTMYFRAKKIIEKFESRTEDHRIIMRAIGAGEVAVSAGLLHLARTATSEVARVAAYTTLAKMLGMQKEILQGSQGVTIIIQGPDTQVSLTPGQSCHTPALPAPQPYQHPTSAIPGKPIQIID